MKKMAKEQEIKEEQAEVCEQDQKENVESCGLEIDREGLKKNSGNLLRTQIHARLSPNVCKRTLTITASVTTR